MPLSAEVFKDEKFRYMVQLERQMKSGQISQVQYLRALYLFLAKNKKDMGCSEDLANAIVEQHRRDYFKVWAAEKKRNLNRNTGPEVQRSTAAVEQVIESTGIQEVKKEFQESQTQRIQSGELPSTSRANNFDISLPNNPREKSDSGCEVDQPRQQGVKTAHDMLKPPGQSSGKLESPLVPPQNQNNATKKAGAPKSNTDEPQFSPELPSTSRANNFDISLPKNSREKSDSGCKVDQPRQQGVKTAHDMLKPPGQSSGKVESPLVPPQNQNNATKKAGAPKSNTDEPQFSPELPSTSRANNFDISLPKNSREKSDSGCKVDQPRQQGVKTAHDMLKPPGQSSGKLESPLVPPQSQNNATKKEAAPKPNTDEPQFSSEVEEIIKNEKGQSLEPLLVERILMEILVGTGGVSWNQIAGLKNVKDALEEMIVLPFLNPNLFQGLLQPGKGLLLFGPPGNGKTMIGKCIAQKCDCTFFSISASSLTSKWIGEGEKMVRTLFTVARIKEPAVIFIDEIDSLLTQRSEGEHESSRRLKTEFLVRLDGLATVDDEKLLIIGATNRPWELDDAARRRFVKKIYVQLPDAAARKQLLKILLSKGKHSLSEEDFDQISERTNGYSCADITNLCKDAAMGPVRSKLKEEGIQHLQKAVPDDLRHIQLADFLVSLKRKKATVDDKELTAYENWNFKFGDVDNSL